MTTGHAAWVRVSVRDARACVRVRARTRVCLESKLSAEQRLQHANELLHLCKIIMTVPALGYSARHPISKPIFF